jgi:hypothetical protein
MLGRHFRAIGVENPIDPDGMLAQIRVRLAHRRQMRLDLALHVTPEAEFVFLVWKILDVDDDLSASRRRRWMLASLFGVERRPVGFPKIGRKAYRFKALLQVKLTVALTRARLARIGFHDGRKAHDVAERLDNSVRALLDRLCDRLFRRLMTFSG